MAKTTTETDSLTSGPTIASTRDYWTMHLRSEGRAERTISTYLRALDRLDGFLAERGMPRELRSIRREHLEAFIVDLQARGNQPATVSILFRALRPFWRWLVDEDEIERSPMEKMRTPSVPINPPAVLKDADVARLLAGCSGTDFIARRDLAMLSLMLDTGMRRGELAGLRVSDLNLGQQMAFIEATTSKSRRGRAVAYGSTTAKAVMRYLRHPRAPHRQDEILWRARTGQPLTGNEIYHTLRRRAAQAGLKVHPHQLRHTWASTMLGSGHSEGDVMVLGGWADRSMLNRYGASAAADRAMAAYRSPVDHLGRKDRE
jgi:site-specific recombinase XerD